MCPLLELLLVSFDGSGNIWLDTSGSPTELVGVAAPVVTPAVTAAVNNTFATRPDSEMSMIQSEVVCRESGFGEVRKLRATAAAERFAFFPCKDDH
jgi:hypothetical protein